MHDPRRRDLLIALNALDIHRPAVIALTRQLDAWRDAPAASRDLALHLGVPTPTLERALRQRREATTVALREQDAAAALDARIVAADDDDYPPALTALPQPPPVLYVRGRLGAGPAVAIVGARAPSPYGREVAALFARAVADAGYPVVSGFARGIDAAAHAGALDAPAGTTVAVLGCGLGVDYPRSNRELAPRIAARGALVSELPCGWPPRAYHFPMRNRLIAALSAGTLVVEARHGSGSLITVRHALELGREVWAVPGRIFEELALGPNGLLRDGATPVLHPRHLIETLPPATNPPGGRQLRLADADPASDGPPTGGESPRARLADRLLATLRPGEPLAADLLADRLRAGIDAVLGALLELELAGAIERLPGPLYHRRAAVGSLACAP